MKDRYLKEFNEENLDLLNGILRDMYDALGSVEADDRIVNLALGDTYVDRGASEAWDFSLVDLTCDNTWRELDLSSIVPAGAKEVKIRLRLRATAIDEYVIFRQNGVITIYNIAAQRTVVANVVHDVNVEVSCDTNRVVEYLGSLNVSHADIFIRGWKV